LRLPWPLPGQRGTTPIQPLAPTLLDPQAALDYSQLEFQPGTPPLQAQDQHQKQRIEPFRASGDPVAFPRPRQGSSQGSRAGQARTILGPDLPSGGRQAGSRRSPKPLNGRRGRFQSNAAGAGVPLTSKSGPRPQRMPVPPSAKELGDRGKPRRPQSPRLKAMVYTLRLLILSVGVGVLAGTLLSVWDPASRLTASNSQQTVQASPSPSVGSLAQMTTAGSEIQPLKAAIQDLAAKTPQLSPGVFLLDLNTNAYVDLNGGTSFAAASTIKLPVLIAFFQDVDQGKVRLDEMLTLSPSVIAKEAGDLQYQPVGTQINALETAVRMITISDNTATNMLIERLGGKEALTTRFQSWGLTATVLRNLLADVAGTNTTTAQEMVWLLSRINRGDFVSMTSRDRIIDILRQTQSTGLLPSGLGTDAKIAHKTGTLGVLLADVGMVDLPNGKRYAIAVLVKRPFQDEAAAQLIQQISKTAYEYFSKPQPAPSPLGFVPAAPTAAPVGAR
jgi:beta-lactamase class A